MKSVKGEQKRFVPEYIVAQTTLPGGQQQRHNVRLYFEDRNEAEACRAALIEHQNTHSGDNTSRKNSTRTTSPELSHWNGVSCISLNMSDGEWKNITTGKDSFSFAALQQKNPNLTKEKLQSVPIHHEYASLNDIPQQGKTAAPNQFSPDVETVQNETLETRLYFSDHQAALQFQDALANKIHRSLYTVNSIYTTTGPQYSYSFNTSLPQNVQSLLTRETLSRITLLQQEAERKPAATAETQPTTFSPTAIQTDTNRTNWTFRFTDKAIADKFQNTITTENERITVTRSTSDTMITVTATQQIIDDSIKPLLSPESHNLLAQPQILHPIPLDPDADDIPLPPQPTKIEGEYHPNYDSYVMHLTFENDNDRNTFNETISLLNSKSIFDTINNNNNPILTVYGSNLDGITTAINPCLNQQLQSTLGKQSKKLSKEKTAFNDSLAALSSDESARLSYNNISIEKNTNNDFIVVTLSFNDQKIAAEFAQKLETLRIACELTTETTSATIELEGSDQILIDILSAILPSEQMDQLSNQMSTLDSKVTPTSTDLPELEQKKETVPSTIDPIAAIRQAINDNDINTLTTILSQNADILSSVQGREHPLFDAVRDEKLAAIEALLPHTNTMPVDDMGNTPLHYATGIRDTAILSALLTQYPNAVDMPDRNGTTPLLFSASQNNPEAAKLLVEKGADILHQIDHPIEETSGNAITYQSIGVISLSRDNAEMHKYVINTISNKIYTAIDGNDIGTLNKIAEYCNYFDIGKYQNKTITESNIFNTPTEGVERSPLLYAAENGNVAAFKILLKSGADIGQRDRDGNNALHVAAGHGQDEMVHTLLEQEGVSSLLHAPNNRGWTPLMMAANRNPQYQYGKTDERLKQDLKCTTLLLEAGAAASINTQSTDSGATALMIAAQHGRDTIVSQLITHGANINAVNKEGNNALMIAAQFGNDMVVSQLIAHRADITAVNNKGRNALEYADLASTRKIIKEAMTSAEQTKEFALPSPLPEPEQKEETVLPTIDPITAIRQAINDNNIDTLTTILSQNADILPSIQGQDHPLFDAVRNEKLAAVEALLPHIDTMPVDENGNTPLHYATGIEDTAILRALLAQYPGAVDIRGGNGTTPLLFSASENNLEAAKLLVENGADILHQIDHPIEKTSDNATTYQSIGVISLARDNAEMHKYVINTISSKIYTAIADNDIGTLNKIAEYCNHFDIGKYQNKTITESNIFNTPTEGVERSPLLYAAENGNVAAFKILLKSGADIGQRDRDGNNALHVAADHGQHEIVSTLLEQEGVSSLLHAPNNRGWTPLMMAANRNPQYQYETANERLEQDLKCTTLLLQAGAASSINTHSTKSGATALMMAAQHGKDTIVSQLIAHRADITAVNNKGRNALEYADLASTRKIIKEAMTSAEQTKEEEFELPSPPPELEETLYHPEQIQLDGHNTYRITFLDSKKATHFATDAGTVLRRQYDTFSFQPKDTEERRFYVEIEESKFAQISHLFESNALSQTSAALILAQDVQLNMYEDNDTFSSHDSEETNINPKKISQSTPPRNPSQQFTSPKGYGKTPQSLVTNATAVKAPTAGLTLYSVDDAVKAMEKVSGKNKNQVRNALTQQSHGSEITVGTICAAFTSLGVADALSKTIETASTLNQERKQVVSMRR